MEEVNIKENTMETKKWWQSKTVWVNIISMTLELVQIFGEVQILPTGTLTLITNVLNIALRYVTKVPLQ